MENSNLSSYRKLSGNNEKKRKKKENHIDYMNKIAIRMNKEFKVLNKFVTNY